MQIPLGALSAVAMKPSATSITSTLVGGAALASAGGSVGLCRSLSYADGGIYCRNYEGTGCVADLGDFPAKRSFRLSVLWSEDKNLYLLEEQKSHNYIQYKDRLYLDASPGAFAPLAFTADNSTLSEGETTWAWTGALGFILWTPSGDPGDATPGGVVKGQGFEWVDVEGYPGLQRAYWNQTRWEEVQQGKEDGTFLTMCYGDYKPSIELGDRP